MYIHKYVHTYTHTYIHTYIHTYMHVYTPTYIYTHVICADYEEISSESVLIIPNSDEAYSLNLTIYNDPDFSEPNETIVIALSVDFLTKLDDAETASLQSRIFLDLPTTTITIVNSGKIYNDTFFPL